MVGLVYGGPCDDADNFQHELRGIIPRSFENLFNHVAREQDMVNTLLSLSLHTHITW
jgi:hypothetical protein